MNVWDQPKRGNRRLLRRLLAVPQLEPAASRVFTGTQPLAASDTPGVLIVTDTTYRAINVFVGDQPGWETRLLFGTHHTMTVAHQFDGPEIVIDLHASLQESLPDLIRGNDVLASDAEARHMVATLDMSLDAVLVYIFPMMTHGTLSGIIVAGINCGLPASIVGGLRAIAMQAGGLLESLQIAEGMRQREAGFRALVESSSDILLVVHPNLTIVDLAPTASRMLGFETEELLGQSLAMVLHPGDVEMAGNAIRKLGDAAHDPASMQWRLRHKDGNVFHAEVVGNNLLHDPGVAGIVLSARDISERKALEASILHQVLHDELTGLPNRTAFMKLVESAVARCRQQEHSLAVLFVDLDRFKVVNDSLGHEAGDKLLVQVARRLRESVRPGDTVARLSGDEFVVLIDNINSPEPVINIAEKILYRLKEAIRIDSHDVFVSSSIGIAVESGDSPDVTPGSILKHADLAMYASKNAGRSGYTLYHPKMTASAVDRLALETELRYAISNSEFQVFYQPLIDLRTGTVNQVEALVRWMHPTRGLLQPDTFISLAEETGLIEPIGQWVLEEACKQGRLWEDQRPGSPPLNVNVNLSVRQFQQRDLVRDVQRTIRSTGLDPRKITLEITESVAFDDAESAVATMRDLKKLGIKLALDDFGTGYSALSYLKQFPVDALKIDRSFIEGLHYDDGDMAIVKAVIAFARTLHLRVTAEGVETPDQLRHLRQLGCDLGQGFYFATPLPGMDLSLDSHYGTGMLSLRGTAPPPQLQEPRIVSHTA